MKLPDGIKEQQDLASIQLKKPKLGENMLNAVNDIVPGLRQTPSYFSTHSCHVISRCVLNFLQ
jgi:hypothetical protein